MAVQQVDADYLIVGAGAMGMAFADVVLAENPSARLTIVDEGARPGGHWNDAYPFVALHQPACYYGVTSESLGRGGAQLASGAEVLAYYEQVMRKFLATGRAGGQSAPAVDVGLTREQKPGHTVLPSSGEFARARNIGPGHSSRNCSPRDAA